MSSIIGKKLGMSQIFKENGVVIPVTLIEAGPCCVVQVKTIERDGYSAVKLGFIEVKKQKALNKPQRGVFEKRGLKSYRILKEFKLNGLSVGDFVTVNGFSVGDKLKVSGVSKGKGFQGVMKRHNYAGGPGGHGSMFNRAPGSIGQSSFPSRVFKNKGLPGHMGFTRVTVENITVVDVLPDQNLLIVKGALPGPDGNIVEIVKC
ncbi:50S ribosomal protein L3 [Candidatus Magnetoovum chiemensis]|nr:50S ribosomal protein L3 [Candidatus Magnetoovum chiemensis]